MSCEEQKRCPLCAEEMDWTDQQFMPCKCGYQVCVWCWHHMIDMAEKDATEGRCPACRTIYEKEKIVAMQTNCERTMLKVSSRKNKPPKAKTKAIEVKKDLTNIRVIQRKMAYVIGLPLSLADEDLLQRKEYFSQYGKVTKVSLSRTAGGAIQQFINDTCSVFLDRSRGPMDNEKCILPMLFTFAEFFALCEKLHEILLRYVTYSKEEEALRCIQSVHGFYLEGRFLRASFGTAKYCHAWLKNTPCNNPACLYLHSIGADEDSFGKDEVAAVHTRSRVHQIVGAANNVIKRSGTVLPPPVDDVHISCSTLSDKSASRNNISDAASGYGNSTTDIVPCKDKEEPIAVPHKLTTFVDIVGRSNSAAPEKDGNNLEDGRTRDLCSALSSMAVGGETHAEAPYSVPSLSKIPSSNHVANGFKISADEPLGECSSLYNQGSTDTCASSQKASFLHPFYSSHISEDSGGALLQKKTPSMNGLTVDQNSVNNQDDEASLPTRCVNSTSNDLCLEMKFQNSAKSDRIYRSSQSFSNEEIVEHLRRIDDDDDNLHNGEEKSVLDAVKSSIISNIMSIDFDSCEDSLPMPNSLSELLNEADGFGGSSWSSLNSDQSGYSFAKQDGYVSQVAASILPEYRDNKEQYLCKPQYPALSRVSRAQSLAPPGFSMPSRDPPPGFSSSDRTSCLPRPSSGGRLANASSFPSTLFQPSSVRHGGSFDDADFFDPAILRSGKGNQSSGFSNSMFEARSTSTPGLNNLDEESRFWLLMQQSTPTHQDPKFSQIFAPQILSSQQQEQSFAGCHKVNGMSGLGNVHGLSSRLVDEYQKCDPSFFTQMPQQKYANGGHVSNSNGYLHSMDEVQQHKGKTGLAEVERNGRLGVNYFPGYGYGDLMISPGDLYTRVFGL